MVRTTAWYWIGFVLGILFLLALDLGVFNRRSHAIGIKEALGWTLLWISLAGLFAAFLFYRRSSVEGMEFVAGYLIEFSLSLDNVFVMALIFSYFQVPLAYQHRVLFWGILGALVLRGAMILLGTALLQQFEWMFYVFGAFLVVAGLRILVSKEEGVHPERNPFMRAARRFFSVTPDFCGGRFLGRIDGRLALTPLALVLLMIETSDILFAMDSIPAVFSVTRRPFLVFTSNVFAILGLRSLYFLLAGALGYFRYLKMGLSIVLVFIGVKMLMEAWVEISIGVSLGVVAGVFAVAMIASMIAAWRPRGSLVGGGKGSVEGKGQRD